MMAEVEIAELTKNQEQDVLDFLAEPGLITRIINDITALGCAGERRNKLLLYLTATSRKMEDPIAAVVRGDSSSGKSYLVEAITKLIPPEDKEVLSRATQQVLFYEGDLAHKLIFIQEAAGSEDASYAIRGDFSHVAALWHVHTFVGDIVHEV
jgi:hypothetical protein